MNSGQPIQEFLFHPRKGSWALAAAWTAYEQFEDEPQRIVKELYYTKDLGETWTHVADHVFEFEWVLTNYVRNKMGRDFIPDDRIMYTQETGAGYYSEGSIDLYYSDDYGVTSQKVFNNVESIIKTEQFIFLQCMHKNGYHIQLVGAKYTNQFQKFRTVRLPL